MQGLRPPALNRLPRYRENYLKSLAQLTERRAFFLAQARSTLAVWALLCLGTGRFCCIPPAIQQNEATFFRLVSLGQWLQAIDNKSDRIGIRLDAARKSINF